MTVEDLHELCLSFRGTSRDHPFGPDTAVYRDSCDLVVGFLPKSRRPAG